MSKIGGLGAGLFVLVLLNSAAAAEESTSAVTSPVVVELFTAQNCSYCPPANAYLTKLAKRKDVIALSFLVDYWSSDALKHLPNHTRRQRDYGHLIGKDRVYTPEMVIGGRRHATGYRRFSVASKIKKEQKEVNGSALEIQANQQSDHLLFTLPATEHLDEKHDIVLIPFKSEMTVSTVSGPFDDRTYTNVAFRPRLLGAWAGETRTIKVALSGDMRDQISGFVMLIQAQGNGPIRGAKKIMLEVPT